MTAEHQQSLTVEENEDTLFKRKETTIQNSDGITLLEIAYYEDGYYAINWQKDSFDPNAFLQSAQRLIDNIVSMPSANPHHGKASPGLKLWKEAELIYEETEEKFVGLESLGVTRGEFNNGRLNTPYGDFWFDLSRGDAKLGIMSHVDAPGYIAAFVMENSQGNVPGHMVEDLVRKLCKQAGDGKINQDLQKQVA